MSSSSWTAVAFQVTNWRSLSISLRASRWLINVSSSMSTVERSRNLLYYFHVCALVNEVINFLRVDIMPSIMEEDSLWLFKHSFPFPFRAAALALSQLMGWVTSPSVVWSLKEINESVVDEPADFALQFGWCLTTSHQWRRLNSYSIWFLYRYFAVSITIASSVPLCLEEYF
jgi:hypothetical protein